MTIEKEHPLPDTSRDHLERRCPRLGGPVTFQYCRVNVGEPLPCWKIVECWWEIFDVNRYLQKELPEEKYQTLLNLKPKPKILSLVELIEQTRKNLAEEK